MNEGGVLGKGKWEKEDAREGRRYGREEKEWKKGNDDGKL